MAILLDNLGENLSEFYSQILKEIGYSDLIEFLWTIFLKSIEKKLGDQEFLSGLMPKLFKLEKKEYVLGSFFSTPKTLRVGISKGYLSREKISKLINSSLKKPISNEDLLKCCNILLLEDNEKLLKTSWRYISGGTLTLSEYKKLQISKKSITDEEIGQDVLFNILNILRENSFRNIYLLVDEVEDIIPIPKQQKRRLLGGLRKIIDKNLRNLMMIISTTMAGWR